MARRKKQDEGQSPENVNENQNQNTDDTFGLPEIEYRPLNRDQPSQPEPPIESSSATSQNQTYKEMEREEVQQNEYNQNTYYDNDDDNGSPWPKILGILAILIIVGGGVWYFGFERPRKIAAEKAQKDLLDAEAKKREQEDLANQKIQEDERRRADSLAAIASPATGVIDTLTERTGRYYVIIASAVDGDLLVDYAKKLTPKGLSPKIIPPYGKVKFYRLAIAEGDTYVSTQATADALKSEYSEGTWVIKY
jgi:hypothetical protein